MRSNGRQIGALALALLPLVAAAGCTGSDPLTPGVGNFETRMDYTNISGRFVDNPFDTALFDIQQVGVRPTDPDAIDNVGVLDLGLLRGTMRANFVSAEPRSVTIGLTAGGYRVDNIVVSRISLTDTDDLTVAGLSDPVNPVCSDFIKSFTYNTVFTVGRASISPQDVVRRVDADNPGSLGMRVDYGEWLDAVLDSINCSSCNCPSLYTPNRIPRFCTITNAPCQVDADCPANRTCEDCRCTVTPSVAFSPGNFGSRTADYLSFE